jgi:DNA modification methylase
MDCLIGLKDVDTESIDLVLTDPPYNIDLKYDEYKDKKPDDVFWDFIKNTYSELFRVLKYKHHLTFTCAQKQIWIYRPMLEDIGFVFRHVGVWHNPKRKAGSYPGQWTYSWEAIMDFTKGGFKKLNNSNSVGFMDIWIEEEPNDTKHPAKRPINCWTDLLNLLSDDNDIVLDPFMGSGTTALVAQRNNRRWIGFELSENYVKEAYQRLQQTTLGGVKGAIPPYPKG